MKKRFINAARVFLLFTMVLPAQAQVAINEIGAFEATDHEWIEIHNPGTEPVDITGFKFWENATNHGLSVFQGDFVIDPGEYAIIAQKADVFLSDKNFAGTIIDSAWGTLNESGEEIGFKDAEGNIIEIFTYLHSPDTALERKDPTLNDATAVNWQPHPESHTAGSQNSNIVSVAPPEPPSNPEPSETPIDETPPAPEEPNDETPAEPPPAIPASPAAGTTAGAATLGPDAIVINELVSDPPDDGVEWIELYNHSDREVDLTGWMVIDGSGSSTKLSGPIGARGFRVIEKPKGNLNNAGDSVTLLDLSGTIFDQISYGNWPDENTNDNALVARDPSALARLQDGLDTGLDNQDFGLTLSPTKGAPNLISAPHQDAEVSVDAPVFSNHIVLNEIYPRPASTTEEFIEIKNIGAVPVNLKNWKLGDASKRRYILADLTIQPNESMVFYRSQTKIAINNSGPETVKIFWPDNTVADSIQYEDAVPEGKSLARDQKNEWVWTETVTPKTENVITQKNLPPHAEMTAPDRAAVGEIITFDASDSLDPEGGKITYFWNFGDGRTDTRPAPYQIYSRAGKYRVTLMLADSLNATTTVEHAILVGAPDTVLATATRALTLASDIFISEFFPNPRGKDQDNEFIELFNAGEQAVNLTGWILDDAEGGSKPYVFPADTLVMPHEYLVLAHEETGLSLNNTNDAVRLMAPDQAPVSWHEYAGASEGSSFIRLENGDYVQTQTPSPGEINVLSAADQQARPARTADIGAARELDDGSTTLITGTVIAEPGVVGAQIMYVADETAGLQIYLFSKRWPRLSRNDRVRIAGILTTVRGEPRLKIKTADDIEILSPAPAPQPSQVSLADVTLERSGALVTIAGEVIEAKANQWTIEDGSEEMKVILKNPPVQKKIQAGDRLVATGIAVITESEKKLLVRGGADLAAQKILGADWREPPNGQTTPMDKPVAQLPASVPWLFAGALACANGLALLRSRFNRSSTTLKKVV